MRDGKLSGEHNSEALKAAIAAVARSVGSAALFAVVLSTSRLEPARACQGIAGPYKFGFRICIE